MSLDCLDNPGEDNDDDYPKLPEKAEMLLEVIEMHELDLDEAGKSLGVKFKVLESNSPDAPAGSKRFFLITGLNHMNMRTRKLKQRNVRNFLAPLFKREVTDETQKWGGIYDMCVQKNVGAGRKVRARTDAVKQGKHGPWIPIHFSQA